MFVENKRDTHRAPTCSTEAPQVLQLGSCASVCERRDDRRATRPTAAALHESLLRVHLRESLRPAWKLVRVRYCSAGDGGHQKKVQQRSRRREHDDDRLVERVRAVQLRQVPPDQRHALQQTDEQTEQQIGKALREGQHDAEHRDRGADESEQIDGEGRRDSKEGGPLRLQVDQPVREQRGHEDENERERPWNGAGHQIHQTDRVRPVPRRRHRRGSCCSCSRTRWTQVIRWFEFSSIRSLSKP